MAIATSTANVATPSRCLRCRKVLFGARHAAMIVVPQSMRKIAEHTTPDAMKNSTTFGITQSPYSRRCSPTPEARAAPPSG